MVITSQEDDGRQGDIKVIRGCPCFKTFGDEILCVNDDNILEMDVIQTDPTLFIFGQNREDMEKEKATDDHICYLTVYLNYPDNGVYCISQGWRLRIHNRDVAASDLEDALQFLSTKELTQSAEICSECLFKFLITLSDTFADQMSLREKTEEVKRYVDKFSLMIAVKHSEMDRMMEPIGTEDDIENGVDHFAFLRAYLVQLLEQQSHYSKLKLKLLKEGVEEWLLHIVELREKLARYEFQFYSQTLNLRDIQEFRLLIRMLQYILRTANDIIDINEEIHDCIRSKRFKEISDERFEHLNDYGEKSRTVEHNFGNILQILSRL